MAGIKKGKKKSKTVFWPVEGSFDPIDDEPDPIDPPDTELLQIGQHVDDVTNQTPDRTDFVRAADAYVKKMSMTVFVAIYDGVKIVGTGITYKEAFDELEIYRKENDVVPSKYKIVTVKVDPNANLEF